MLGKLFSKKAKEQPISLVSPLTGTVIPLEQVPDPVFSQKIVGDGVAIKPTEGTLVSPVKGKIAHLGSTYHAIGILSDDGLEILLHIGIDTVKLEGCGFTPLVAVGDRVNAGDKLIEVDLQVIEQAGYSTITPVLITNGDKVANCKHLTDKAVQAGRDQIMELILK